MRSVSVSVQLSAHRKQMIYRGMWLCGASRSDYILFRE